MQYSDLSITGSSLSVVRGINSIEQSLEQLINTQLKSRFFEPTIGFNDEDVLFEVFDDDNADILYKDKVGLISMWEPRIILNNSQSSIIADPDNRRYIVTLIYDVVGSLEQSQSYITDLTGAN
jgi:phage baseplate assembly protein W